MYWMMHRGAALNSLAMLLKFKAVEQWYDGGREHYKNSYHPAEELKPNFDPKGKICAEFEYFEQFCNWIDRYWMMHRGDTVYL